MSAAAVARALTLHRAIAKADEHRHQNPDRVVELQERLHSLTGGQPVRFLAENDTGEPMVVFPADVFYSLLVLAADGARALRECAPESATDADAAIKLARQTLEDLR